MKPPKRFLDNSANIFLVMNKGGDGDLVPHVNVEDSVELLDVNVNGPGTAITGL